MADVQIDQDAANIPAVNLVNGSGDPTAPGSGHGKLYLKEGVAYVRLDTGSPTPVGGAPSLAEGQLAVGDGSGLLSALGLGTEGDVVTADANGMATWAAPDAPAGGAGAGGHVTILPWFYDSYEGAELAQATSTGAWAGVQYTDAPGAQNNSWTYKVYLDAGTYTFAVYGTHNTNRGIISLQIDGTEVGTVDQYNASSTVNQKRSVTGIVVAAAGLKSLRLKMLTKNASSSGYVVGLEAMVIYRTA